MIRMGWMTDKTRVIGSTSQLVNMWRIMQMPAGVRDAMENEIYDAEYFAAGPMMWGIVSQRPKAKKTFALTRSADFRPPNPRVEQCAYADALGQRFATSDDELLVVGGKRVFELLLPYASTLHIAETDRTFPGRVVFNAWETAPGFELASQAEWPGGRTLKYTRDTAHLKTAKGDAA